jgi:hypothetical protein
VLDASQQLPAHHTDISTDIRHFPQLVRHLPPIVPTSNQHQTLSHSLSTVSQHIPPVIPDVNVSHSPSTLSQHLPPVGNTFPHLVRHLPPIIPTSNQHQTLSHSLSTVSQHLPPVIPDVNVSHSLSTLFQYLPPVIPDVNVSHSLSTLFQHLPLVIPDVNVSHSLSTPSQHLPPIIPDIECFVNTITWTFRKSCPSYRRQTLSHSPSTPTCYSRLLFIITSLIPMFSHTTNVICHCHMFLVIDVISDTALL